MGKKYEQVKTHENPHSKKSNKVNSICSIKKFCEDKGFEIKQVDINKFKGNTKKDKCSNIIGLDDIKDAKGVYFFTTISDISLDKSFFECTKLYNISRKNNRIKISYAFSVSSKYLSNKDKNNIYPIKLEKNRILYVGQAENLYGRIKEHLTNNKFSGCKSMKLGFEERKVLVDNINCYVIIIPDESKRSYFEREIRKNFVIYFGER